ncbi:MAG: hypothetical protein AMJ61_10820 [Desulfobacterales bacterium SG8_35_2]|nr:MAG: hypothetical protein AMJ61_10820 [Desulfobacterales bacterium SG8_35_2]
MKAFVTSECPLFWDEFVQANSSLLFHRSIWARVLQDGYGGTPLFCWLETEASPVVGMMGLVMDFKVVRVLYAALPYGGLIGDDSAAPDFFRIVEPELRKHGVHKIQIPEPRHAPILERAGFTSEEIARHQVNVSGHDAESLEASFPRSVRKAIRKSRKENIEIREVLDRSEIKSVFDLYMKTMAHNKAAAKYPIGRFLSIFDYLVPKGLGVILIASCNGRLVGSNTLVCSDDTVHDIQLSYDHVYQHVRPNDALVWASLQWTMDKGKKWFDFMGSHAGDVSLEKFKSKWGAQRTTTCNYTKTLSPLRGACWSAVLKMAGHPMGGWFIRLLRKANAQQS